LRVFEKSANIHAVRPCGAWRITMALYVQNYGKYFAELIEENVATLIESGFQRERNAGAPHKFGENHLREHIRKNIVATEWPHLVFERRLANDNDHGNVDYCFLKPRRSRFDLNEVLATCELKGPTRRSFLKGSKRNWYPAILADLKKQLVRAKLAPSAQHYLALIITPVDGADVRDRLNTVFDQMLGEVHEAKITYLPCIKVHGLYVILSRVEPRKPPVPHECPARADSSLKAKARLPAHLRHARSQSATPAIRRLRPFALRRQ
jgi:hypothetical protein